MNVLFILKSSSVTDEEIYVSTLARGLKGQGINPFIIFAVDGHPGMFSYQQVKEFAIPELCFRAYDLEWANNVAKQVDKLGIDWIVTFSDRFDAQSPVDSKLASYHIADIVSACKQRPKTLLIGYDITADAKRSIANTKFDKYIAVSANTASHLMPGVDPLIVRGAVATPSGIDVDIREFYGIPKDAFVLGYIGELSKRMNTPLLIDVAKKLRCFLLICGSGELIDEIDKHKHMTKMLPMIPPNRANWYEAMSVFIYPSISSGFPAFPLEAVTMNVPIAISPISDFYSTFGDSMAFFNPNKGVDAAVEAVEKAKAIDPATTRGIAMDKLSEGTMLSGFMSVIDG